MNTEASARTRAIVLPIMSRWLEENPADAKRVADLADRRRCASRTKSQRRAAGRPGPAVEGLEVAQRPAAEAARLHRQDRTPHRRRLLLSRATRAGGTALDARDPSSRRSCRCAASRSTPTRRPSTGWSSRSPTSSCPWAAASATTSTSTSSATTASSAWPTPTTTASTSARSSRCSSTRWCPGFIESGRLLYAMPPLWSTMLRGERIYLADDAALAAFRAEHPDHRAHVSRMKGLGEMDHQELRLVIGLGPHHRSGGGRRSRRPRQAHRATVRAARARAARPGSSSAPARR